MPWDTPDVAKQIEAHSTDETLLPWSGVSVHGTTAGCLEPY